MKRAWSAELVRTRGSAAAWLTLLGLVFALLSSGFSEAVKNTGDVHDLLNWQGLYVTGLAAPIMTLMAGLVFDREQQAREGGTLWRSTSRSAIIVARVLMLWILSLVFHLFSYGGIVGVALINHFEGFMGPVFLAGSISWLASVALCIPGLLLARWVGTIPAVLMSVVFQVVGTMAAEKPWWWLVPMAWPVRPGLWALGVHQNAVPLEPGEIPAIHEPWSALALCVMGAAVATAGLIISDAHQSRVSGGLFLRRQSHGVSRSTGGGEWGSVRLMVSGGAGRWLTLVSVFVLGVLAVSHRPGMTAGLFSYAILPLGAMILPVLMWSRARGGWKLASLQSPAVGWVLLIRLLVHVGVMVGFAVLAVLVEGDTQALGRRVLLWVLTGWVMALMSFAVSVRWGAGVAVGGALVWWIFSVTFAGDVLASTSLWLVSLPVWAECADTPGRVGVAVCASVVLGVVSFFVAKRVERGSLRTVQG